MAHGEYSTYLIYPPGWSSLSAVICRFCDLPPLSVFPVIAPALLVLTTLAAYALATRLWGWEFGLAAAALSGPGADRPVRQLRRRPVPGPDGRVLPHGHGRRRAGHASTSRRRCDRACCSRRSARRVVLFHSVGAEYLAVLLAVRVRGLPALPGGAGRPRGPSHRPGADAVPGRGSACCRWPTPGTSTTWATCSPACRDTRDGRAGRGQPVGAASRRRAVLGRLAHRLARRARLRRAGRRRRSQVPAQPGQVAAALTCWPGAR